MLNRRCFIQIAVAGGFYCAFPFKLSAKQEKNLLYRTPKDLSPLADVQRVLSAGRVSDILLMALCPEKVVGIATELTEKNKPFLSAQIQHIPYIGRLAGRGSTAPLEKILATQAQLIIDVGEVSETYLSTAEKVYRQTRIPYLLLNGSLQNTPEQLLTLGRELNVVERAQKLADYADKVLSLTHNICQRDSLKVYLARSADGLETGLQGSIHTEVIEWFNAQNVAAGAGEKRLARVSAEQILLWQPDVIVTQDLNFYRHLQESPLWQNFSAVKNKRYYLAPDTPFGWLDGPPGVNRLLGCLWLAHTLAPDRLPEMQFRSLAMEFFQLFYGTPISPEKLTALLGRS